MKEATMYQTVTRILPAVLVASWLALAAGCAERDSTPDEPAHAGGEGVHPPARAQDVLQRDAQRDRAKRRQREF